MMIPCDGPKPGRTAPVLGQCKGEGGKAQPAKGVWPARRGGDFPARFRRACERRRSMAQKKTKAAAFARSKRKPTCGGEIGHRAILRQLGDDASQRTALERFFHRPQGIER